MIEYILLTKEYCDSTTQDCRPAATIGPTDEVRRLRDRIGALELAVETLGRMLVKSGHVTEADFFSLAREIDLEDGILDGRRDLTKMKKICPACSRICSAEKVVCLWCGADISLVEAGK